ncbi:hypothetical protein HJFPF1_12151 [Paramyrothecium foliicola]|nr:hypothetical protein HJFPF1_12151 [Paramyrothecium foliicola]
MRVLRQFPYLQYLFVYSSGMYKKNKGREHEEFDSFLAKLPPILNASESLSHFGFQGNYLSPSRFMYDSDDSEASDMTDASSIVDETQGGHAWMIMNKYEWAEDCISRLCRALPGLEVEMDTYVFNYTGFLSEASGNLSITKIRDFPITIASCNDAQHEELSES